MDILAVWNVFFNNNEEDEYDWPIDHDRELHIKINNFFENVVLFYSLTGNDKFKCNIYCSYFIHNVQLMLNGIIIKYINTNHLLLSV